MATQAVVVGAGPAGCAAAAMLAQRGWQVDVFERRPHLEPSGLSRGYPMALTSRALDCLKLANLSPTYVLSGSRELNSMYANAKETMKRWTNDRLSLAVLVDRQHLGWDLYQAANAQEYPNGGKINWHWDQALEDIDLKARTATFVPDQASQGLGTTVKTAVTYDLLIGADGYKSAVRGVLQRELPSMSCDVLFTPTKTYKTFSGLPIIPEVDALLPKLRQELPMQHVYFFNRPGGSNIVLWKLENNTVSGLLTGDLTYDQASLQPLLDSYNLPEQWMPLVMEQVLEGKQQPSKLGQICRVSQLHGPNCVLLGDAAHPVTSGIGQGCNVALEDVRVFTEVLDKVGVDQAPAAYNKARLRDAHAVQAIEYNMQTLIFNWGTQKSKWRLILEKARAIWLLGLSALPWAVGHKLLPGVFTAPNFISSAFRDSSWSYSQVVTAMHAQSALAVCMIAGVLTAAAKLAGALVQLLKPMLTGA